VEQIQCREGTERLLQIIAADLTDAYGRPIDGNDDGVPGGNYVAIVTKNGGTAAAVAAPATMMARAVDAVIHAGQVGELPKTHRLFARTHSLPRR